MPLQLSLSATKANIRSIMPPNVSIELILLVKHLLYTEKYTIEGARQKVDEHRKGGELRGAARAALTVQTLESLEVELKELVRFLSSGA